MSGALRRLLRSMRLTEVGTDDLMSLAPNRPESRVAESPARYPAHIPYDAAFPYGAAPTPGNEAAVGDETEDGQGLLRRLIFDMAADRHPSDDVSLGQMLDLSRERWFAGGDIDAGLFDALMAERAEEDP